MKQATTKGNTMQANEMTLKDIVEQANDLIERGQWRGLSGEQNGELNRLVDEYDARTGSDLYRDLQYDRVITEER